MLCQIFLAEDRGALQTQIGGGEGGGDGAAVHGLGSLGLHGGQVKDVSQNGLVVLDRCIGSGLVLVEETLDMFCMYVLALVVRQRQEGGGRPYHTRTTACPAEAL